MKQSQTYINNILKKIGNLNTYKKIGNLNIYKRIGIIAFSFILLFSDLYQWNSYGITNSANSSIFSSNLSSNLSSHELLDVIIELQEAPLIERVEGQINDVSDYHKDSYIKNQQIILLRNQDLIKSRINLLLGRQVEYYYSYTNAMNGFSAQLSSMEMKLVKSLPGIKCVNQSQKYRLLNAEAYSTSKVIVGSEINTVDIGFKGEGMVVAIIDSGIDYSHKDLRLGDYNTAKITKNKVASLILGNKLKASVTVNNLETSQYYINSKFPFAFDYADRDTNSLPVESHGTHVAGIVAANTEDKNGITGIAPEAQIISMKVFKDENKEASEDDILAAIEDAITLEADVINLSLGYETGIVGDQTAKRYSDIFNLANKIGITVVGAAGNESKVGTIDNSTYKYPLADNPDNGFIAFPASLPSVIAVASSNDKDLVMPYFTLSSGDRIYYTDSSGQAKVDPFDTVLAGMQLDLVYVGLGTEGDYAGKNVKGKVVVIDRGIYTFNEKVLNAEKHGAVGAIVINYDTENLLMLLTDVTIPAVCITSTYQESLMKELRKASPCIVVEKGAIGTVSNVDSISKFSSSGVSTDLSFKPDISAPGELIISTAKDNERAAQNGTSMAAPQVSAATLLMKQYINSKYASLNLGTLSYNELSSILLLNGAKIALDHGNTPISPRRQGAGILDVVASTKLESIMYDSKTKQGKIQLGDNLNHEFTMSFTLKNLTNRIKFYEPAVSVLTSEILKGEKNQLFTLDSEQRLSDTVITLVDNNSTNTNTYNNVSNNRNMNKYSANYLTETIRLQPQEEKVVTFKVALGKVDMEYLSQSVNGAIIEGFIELRSTTVGVPVISIPYLGFQGDWGTLPIIDYSEYDEETPYFRGQYAITEYDGVDSILGQNRFIGGEVYDYDLIAISPNGDRRNEFMMAYVNLLRDTKVLAVDILDDKGRLVTKWSFAENMPKMQVSQYAEGRTTTRMMRFFGRDNNQNLIPEGSYKYVVKAQFQGGEYIDTWEIPFVVDITPPTIVKKDISIIDGIRTLELSIRDNHYIQSVIVKDGNNKTISEIPIKGTYEENIITAQIPLANIQGDTVSVKVIDYASNEVEDKIKILNAQNASFTLNTDVNKRSYIELNEYMTTTKYNEELYYLLERQSLFDSVVKNSVDYVLIDIQDGSHKKYIDFSQGVLQSLKTKNVNIMVKNDEIEYLIPIEALTAAKGNISIELSQSEQSPSAKDYENLGYNYGINIYSNQVKLSSLSRKINVSITLDDQLKKNSDLNRISSFHYEGNTFIPNITYLRKDSLDYKMDLLGNHSLLLYKKRFADVNGGWAVEYINSLASKHIIKGTTETTFSPYNTITRAEFVSMVVRAIDSDIEVNTDFIGMDKNAWYYPELIKAKQLGLIYGDSYDALEPINRFEMAVVASKAHAIINNKVLEFNGKLEFTDVTPDSMSTYIGYAYINNIISGYPDKTYRPRNHATREEITRVIYALVND